ncbi:T9SS type A sorting domain-containing protein [Rhodocytophaga rosea]|uniref:T9SS type A sorting domain-containing protein n=1 Tax=Rhodocytophaga rosea TaxID=2704465 RepID=A0A6C0GS70_9BACT|nr:ELWxxDGT repeat protein [Rhodocytophaga rosea]QHT70453.1 T9SS type A sorting domain-containing protein [Rhodocytophaga rosea]
MPLLLLSSSTMMRGKHNICAKAGVCLKFSLIVSFMFLCFFSSFAQPTLVKDINTASAKYFYPMHLTQSNGILYFSASDPTHGQELWRSDGTPEGTFLLKDLNPGLAGSNPSHLLDVNGTLYFVANGYSTNTSYVTRTGGYQLWKTDGTLAGTQKVADVSLGRWDIEESPAPIVLTKAGNTVFYSTDNNPYWYYLKSSKGGSFWINRIYGEETLFTEVNNTLYISGSTYYGSGLLKTDGTEEGTSLIFAGDFPKNISSVNGILFFTAYDPVNKHALWKSDGTPAGTVLVKSIPGIIYSSLIRNTDSINGIILYFAAGSVLWKSDGTSEGTMPMKEFAASSFIYALQAVNGTLFFINGRELWKSDGTTAGTTLVKDIGAGSSEVLPSSGGYFYFKMYEPYPSKNFSLWRSDGSQSGTIKLKNFNQQSDYYYFDNRHFADVKGTLFFVPNTDELWKSDGTSAGTVKINISLPTMNGASSPQSITRAGNTLYFSANNGIQGEELWKSDGTSAGTTLVKDIYPGAADAAPSLLTAVNSVVYFSASDSLHGRELWKSDGTPEGTVLVRDIYPGTATSNVRNLIQVNGTLFFTANHPSYGEELWKSDGTPAGTVMVKDIVPGIERYDYRAFNNITVVNGLLYFTTSYPTPNNPNYYTTIFWKSDGTPAGTVQVKDINPGYYANIGNLINVNGTLFFTANDGIHGIELWKSDGTPAGTVMVKDIVPGKDGAYPEQLITNNGLLYFVFYEPSTGYAIWKSDGTAQGTSLFRKLPSGSEEYFSKLRYINGRFYFFSWRNIDDGGDGTATLWTIEDTAGSNPVKLKDNFYGRYSYSPSVFFSSNGILYFVMNDGKHGNELWRSDGTIAGTALVDDLPGSPYNDTFATLNNTLYFSIYTQKISRELWKYDPSACVSVTNKNLLVQANSVCLGQDGKILLKGSQANVPYQAYLNNAAIGNPVQGGGDITLTIPAVSLNVGNNTFTIKASGCTLVELTSKATITVLNCPTISCNNTTQSSLVVNPSSGSILSGTSLYLKTIPGASSYTLQVSTSANFTTGVITKTTASRLSIGTFYASFPELSLNQKYYVRVYTNLGLCWGPVTSFTTASAAGSTYVVNPSDGSTTTGTSLYLNTVPTATSYTVQVSTSANFTTGVLTKTTASRLSTGTYYAVFAELALNQKYYVRVKTNLSDTWGRTTSFTRVNATARLAASEESVQENLENKASLYPNPFEDKLTLVTEHTGKHSIHIVDNLGRTVYQATTQGNQTELNLAHLKAGVYMLKLSTEEGQTQVSRVIKK